jgi:hypothetical protein
MIFSLREQIIIFSRRNHMQEQVKEMQELNVAEVEAVTGAGNLPPVVVVTDPESVSGRYQGRLRPRQ